ncbi:hypothetical protein DM826_03055 [Halonotius aquaticus]|uniref:Uncharacterized protein n=1 Tax=Halonotius aquaticus TaxID=2216978 RepID=A0A3A6PZB1_9EURY|nr:hypothetical protein DM826_03055 [Halonotius aquaticus]
MNCKRLTGLYHATGPTSLTRYYFTCELAIKFGCDADLATLISTEEFRQEAPIPTNSGLDPTRLYDQLDHKFKTPAEAGQSMSAIQEQ